MNDLLNATRFFAEHAGGVVGRRFASALALARAEQWGREEGIRFDWEPDPEPYETDIPGDEPEEVYGCVAYSGSEHVASLWAIADPSPEYRRVVEAELAYMGCMSILRREVENVLSI